VAFIARKAHAVRDDSGRSGAGTWREQEVSLTSFCGLSCQRQKKSPTDGRLLI
jgi:hypothetical protein